MARSDAPDRSVALRRFLRWLPLTLVASMVLWYFALRPILDGTVAWSAESLIRAFEYPRVTQLVTVNNAVEIRRADLRSDSRIPTVALAQVHFNTIVMLALYLALPRPLSRTQLERLFMGWTILIVTQTLNLVFHVKCVYALSMGEWSQVYYSDLARNVYGFLRYFTDLPGRFSFPFLIWLGFNWDHVAGLVGLENGEPEVGAKDRRKGGGKSKRKR